MSKLDRSEINRALAKAIAYHDCGKRRETERWAVELVRLLGCGGILDAHRITSLREVPAP